MDTSFVMTTTPQKSSDIILNQIKTSNLHFNVNETPFSLYITIRKKFLRAPLSSTPANHQQQIQIDRNLIEENASLRESVHRLENELLEAREILDTTGEKLQKANHQISELLSRNTSLEKDSRTKTEKIWTLTADTKRLDDELSRCNIEVLKVKKVLKVKEKESHKSQTKVDNLEETLAKNKVEKTALVREVSNLKKSVKSLEKKARKNDEKSELAQTQKKVPMKASKISITTAGEESEMWKKV
jgi:chromosome segregation ATPase